jgi:hypothetical protein
MGKAGIGRKLQQELRPFSIPGAAGNFIRVDDPSKK